MGELNPPFLRRTMRFRSTQGNKQDHLIVAIKNNDTVTIQQGAPVILDRSSDGINVLSIESLDETNRPFFFGFALETLAAGAVGDSIVFGFYLTVRYIANSRSASSVSWATTEAHVAGEQMDFYTTPGIQAMSLMGTIPDATLPQVFVAVAIASLAGVASATSDTRLVSTGTVKAFVRAM
jgi:hypothetical protein